MTNTLANLSLEREKKISFFIERQFPSLYRENGKELIELVKFYYKFLEENEAQSVYNIRRIYEYRDIDTTLDRMLIFFKNKFLNGLFFDKDVRFIVKNILDLYRRKGSKEGIELFFRMFFNSEVDIYYPSYDMFKPSDSLWKVGSFLQLYPVNDIKIFDNIINTKIFGDRSDAEAFVDNVYILNIDKSIIPLLTISDVKGKFVGFDTVYSLERNVVYGQVYGSLKSVDIDDRFPSASGNNKVGDVVEILPIEDADAYSAKGKVTKVTTDLSGELIFDVKDGLYGYTIENTDIVVSDQTAFFAENVGFEYNVNERVVQKKPQGDSFGIIIGRTRNSIGIKLEKSSNVFQLSLLSSAFAGTDELQLSSSDGVRLNQIVSFQNSIPVNTVVTEINENNNTIKLSNTLEQTIVAPAEIIFTANLVYETSNIANTLFIETVDRTDNIMYSPAFVSEYNNSAAASVGTLKNTETVRLITDTIENFLNVQLNSINYSQTPPALAQMSGTRINQIIPTISTTLNTAFVPETFTIGEIETLNNVNLGFNYTTDSFAFAKENLLSRFNLRDQIIEFISQSGVFLKEGDEITQRKIIQTFESDLQEVTVKGVITRVIGNIIYVKQKTFESFVSDETFRKVGSSIDIAIVSISRDLNTAPLGLNAVIDINLETVIGKILEIDVIDTGVGYEDKRVVGLINTTRETTKRDNSIYDALGVANSRGQGFTEGRWITFTSHTNREKKIQDSFFYQDYSYEISTDVNPSIYEDTYKELIHTSGIKLFTAFSKKDTIESELSILGPFINIYAIEETDLIEENGSVYVGENGYQYINTNLTEV
jgi:hypothetical protein